MSDDVGARLALMQQLVAMYPQREVGEATVVGYLQATSDLPLEALRAAVAEAIKTEDWLPPVAKLRRLVVERLAPALPAGDAWGLVLREVSRVGWRGTPEFSHPAIAEAVKSIGWNRICLGEATKVQEEFGKVFDKTMARHQSEVMAGMRPLAEKAIAP